MTIEELEPIVMELKDKIDGILNTVAESEKKFQHDKGLEEFTERNREALGKYENKLKKLNGDDFDIFSASFDEYQNDFSDIEEATYIAQLVSEIDNKINKLKEALGEDDIEIHSNAEGETEVNSHDTEIEAVSEESKEVAEDAAEDDAEKEAEESVEEEEKDAEESAEDAAEEDVESEFVKELEDEYAKYHK